MYVVFVPNRSEYRGIYLRESYREGNKIRKKTIANISSWELNKIAALQLVLKGETRIGTSSFKIIRSLPHGAVAAVLSTMKRIGLSALLSVVPIGKRNLIQALIADRIISHQSKLATARELDPGTQTNTLYQELNLEKVTPYDLYAAMDTLIDKKPVIEKSLGKKHLTDRCLLLYDLTSVYFEGTKCPLALRGHSKDKKKGVPQIMVGLLTNKDGIPVSTEVFAGNTLDHQTLVSQIEKAKNKFGMTRLIIVGDRGTIITKRIEEDLKHIEGLSYITALKSAEINELVKTGSLQLSLFDDLDLAEIESPLYAQERLICCRNPFLAREREEKREELLKATEKELEKIRVATKRQKRALKGEAKIGLRVGKILNKYKMGKHFNLTIKKNEFSYQQNEQSIQQEKLLDGIYIIRTSVVKEEVTASEAVAIYKGLSRVEKAFRCMKTTDLKIRPVYHYLTDRVKAHVFLCMLAYYVEWHMRKALAPLLFEDEDKEEASLQRESVVAKAVRSDRAKNKAQTKMTEDGFPVHSFQSLLADLSTLTRNTIQPLERDSLTFDQITEPTPLQKKALELLEISGNL